VAVHELSLCQRIYEIADRSRDGRSVEVVRLRIGDLRQAVPDTLTYCWGLLTDSTPLAGSVLEIERIPVEFRCTTCGSVTRVGEDLDLACPSCGGIRVEILAGEEFVLDSMDLGERADVAAAGDRDG
jgi:hydrogenase nickel incorporation protein HypA/HybF